jgi:hypothetical protein
MSRSRSVTSAPNPASSISTTKSSAMANLAISAKTSLTVLGGNANASEMPLMCAMGSRGHPHGGPSLWPNTHRCRPRRPAWMSSVPPGCRGVGMSLRESRRSLGYHPTGTPSWLQGNSEPPLTGFSSCVLDPSCVPHCGILIAGPALDTCISGLLAHSCLATPAATVAGSGETSSTQPAGQAIGEPVHTSQRKPQLSGSRQSARVASMAVVCGFLVDVRGVVT